MSLNAAPSHGSSSPPRASPWAVRWLHGAGSSGTCSTIGMAPRSRCSQAVRNAVALRVALVTRRHSRMTAGIAPAPQARTGTDVLEDARVPFGAGNSDLLHQLPHAP